MTEARMQETPEFKPGTFCWVELGTTDGEAAKKFYTELFGWGFEDIPLGPDKVYTILKLNGKDVGAVMPLQGIPPNWLSYVSVTSADESAAKAKSLGANLMKEPFDVMDVGRMAVIQDPTGAVFAIWQAKKHKGAGIVNVPGALVWNELTTTDTARAGDFYSGLFGWGIDAKTFGSTDYTIFQNGDRGAAGMFKLTPDLADVPPFWLVYFAVDDCDAKVKKATELGATTIKPADDIPGVGRFAILQDPQGAAFAIIKTEPASA
jgi:predicted enzyme related to lactoylglutathione lyase